VVQQSLLTSRLLELLSGCFAFSDVAFVLEHQVERGCTSSGIALRRFRARQACAIHASRDGGAFFRSSRADLASRPNLAARPRRSARPGRNDLQLRSLAGKSYVEVLKKKASAASRASGHSRALFEVSTHPPGRSRLEGAISGMVTRVVRQHLEQKLRTPGRPLSNLVHHQQGRPVGVMAFEMGRGSRSLGYEHASEEASPVRRVLDGGRALERPRPILSFSICVYINAWRTPLVERLSSSRPS